MQLFDYMSYRNYWIGIIVLLFLTGLPTTKTTIQAGDLISCPDIQTVYYISSDNKRWVFPNDKTFFTWFSSFDNIKHVPCSKMSEFTLGPLMTYKPQIRLIKIQSSPTVYEITSEGKLDALLDEAYTAGVYGDNWQKLVDDIPEHFWFAYLKEPLLTELP